MLALEPPGGISITQFFSITFHGHTFSYQTLIQSEAEDSSSMKFLMPWDEPRDEKIRSFYCLMNASVCHQGIY